MTFIQEKIDELKHYCAQHFKIAKEKIDGKSRRREVSDARKCLAILSRKHYPEISGSVISKMINKERSSFRKLLHQSNNLYKTNKYFRERVNTVEKEIKKTRCSYCKTIIK